MKKALLLFASALLLLVGCQKEKFDGSSDNGETIEVSFTAMLEKAEATRAVADNDGHAAKVNHWVLQVYEAGENGALFYQEERDVAAGTLTQTYELKLFKNQSYDLLFWADTKGAYNTDDLRTVSTVDLVANKDSRDAFSANELNYKSSVSESKSVTLKRPFAQLNIITCDLKALKEKVFELVYAKYAPAELKVVATIPTTFNVQTQKAGTAAKKTLSADASYADFTAGEPETTLFMDYIFASAAQKDIVNIAFSFKTDGNPVSYDFNSIPLQRNYRTNIKGNLMSNDSKWTVTIDPQWNTPEYDVPYLAASTIAEAQSYIAPKTEGTQTTKVVDLSKATIQETDITGDDKKIEFKLKTTSPIEMVNFTLPAIPSEVIEAGCTGWKITHDPGYPTENVNVTAPNGTSVTIDAPSSHVTLNGEVYEQVTATTGPNTLVVPEGVTVKNLTVKEGAVEIHGAVNSLTVTPDEGKKVVFRACEGLSADVFKAIKGEGHDYIDYPMYTYKQVGEKFDIYKLPVVAMIGEVEYPSIATALAAAKANDVIDVVAESVEMPTLNKADITVKGNGTTKVTKFDGLSGKNITLDGFEFTVQTNPSGENFVIKNSQFTGDNGLRYAYAKGNVLIENCIFDTKTYGIHFDGNSGGKATVKNCEIVGFNTFNPELTFENCRFVDSKKSQYYVVQGYSNVAFKDCSFSEKWCDANPQVQTIGLAKDQGFAEINDCTFAVGTVLDACKNSGLGVIAIDATGNATDGFTAGIFVAKQASDIKAAPSYIVTAVEGKENVWTVSGPYEARIGQVYYTTLQAAVDAVQTGETITLLCNIMDFPNIENILLKDFSVDAQGTGFDSYYIKNATTGIRYYDGGKTIRGSLTYPYETLEIPEGVTATIGAKNYDGTNLKYVKLPSTMRILADGAFCKAKNLEKIYYKDGDEYKEGLAPYLTKIGEAVFQETESFNMPIVIPGGITSIGNKTFYESSVISVVLPEGLISIGSDGLRGARNLTEITIPASLQTIGNQAFRDCAKLKTINLLFETVPQTIGSFTFNAVSAMFGATTPGVIYVKNQAVADALYNVFDRNAKDYYSIKNYDDKSVVYYKGAKIQ